MKGSKRKNILVKNHITRQIDTTFCGIKALEALMQIAIA
jgi:hypothetical protein